MLQKIGFQTSQNHVAVPVDNFLDFSQNVFGGSAVNHNNFWHKFLAQNVLFLADVTYLIQFEHVKQQRQHLLHKLFADVIGAVDVTEDGQNHLEELVLG